MSENNEIILEWGHCLSTCPSEDIRPVCQMLPTYPSIGNINDGRANYTTNIDSYPLVATNDVTLGVNLNFPSTNVDICNTEIHFNIYLVIIIISYRWTTYHFLARKAMFTRNPQISLITRFASIHHLLTNLITQSHASVRQQL